jgi:hypothetical protein
MTENWHDPMIGVDGLTMYQRWLKSDAPYKAECRNGLCISFYHPIDCNDCDGRNTP